MSENVFMAAILPSTAKYQRIMKFMGNNNIKFLMSTEIEPLLEAMKQWKTSKATPSKQVNNPNVPVTKTPSNSCLPQGGIPFNPALIKTEIPDQPPAQSTKTVQINKNAGNPNGERSADPTKSTCSSTGVTRPANPSSSVATNDESTSHQTSMDSNKNNKSSLNTPPTSKTPNRNWTLPPVPPLPPLPVPPLPPLPKSFKVATTTASSSDNWQDPALEMEYSEDDTPDDTVSNDSVPVSNTTSDTTPSGDHQSTISENSTTFSSRDSNTFNSINVVDRITEPFPPKLTMNEVQKRVIDSMMVDALETITRIDVHPGSAREETDINPISSRDSIMDCDEINDFLNFDSESHESADEDYTPYASRRKQISKVVDRRKSTSSQKSSEKTDKPASFMCVLCGKGFNGKRYLTQHNNKFCKGSTSSPNGSILKR